MHPAVHRPGRASSSTYATMAGLTCELVPELDALYFHLYGIARDDVDRIMETFPIVKRKDIAAHGKYRARRAILEMHDQMATAGGVERYQTWRLTPPPADPSVVHPPKEK